MHPWNQTYIVDHRPAYMLDDDSQSYWSWPLGSSSSIVLLEFWEFTTHITYTKVEWNFKPEYFQVRAFSLPCWQYYGVKDWQKWQLLGNYSVTDTSVINLLTTQVTDTTDKSGML